MNAMTAEENLRVIRGLMEKATIYRAISFPAAGFAGALAVGVGIYGAFSGTTLRFQTIWLGVLLICTLVNFYFLFREARKRDEPFLSSGMLLAVKCMLPILLLSALVTACLFFDIRLAVPLAIAWNIAYGLLLLSTQTFAPPSLTRLGWVFFLSGIVLAIAIPFNAQNLMKVFASWGISFSHLLMACTFGLYHLIYAVAGYIVNSKSKAP